MEHMKTPDHGYQTRKITDQSQRCPHRFQGTWELELAPNAVELTLNEPHEAGDPNCHVLEKEPRACCDKPEGQGGVKRVYGLL